MKLELYFSPGSCPRVSMIALEEAGIPFDTHLVAFMAGDHRKPEFLARNPSGKVPVLMVDGQPIVTRIAFPQIMIDHPEGTIALRAKALEMMAFQLKRFEARLEQQTWLAGPQWSVLDAYLHWVWFRITGAGFDPAPFPGIADHYARTLQRPSVQRVLAREAEAVRELEGRGLMPRPRA